MPAQAVIAVDALSRLFDVLTQQDYHILGPTVRDGAIVYETITTTNDLPRGWTDAQDGGTYRLERRADEALFGYTVGPHTWKRFLHPPTLRLWQAQRQGDGFTILPETAATPRYAFFGVRACELHAIAIQDRVFVQGTAVDPIYAARREQLCLIAVNCTQAGGTCFCASMHTGPRVTTGADLVLTEVLEGTQHVLVVEAMTTLGEALLRHLPQRPAGAEDMAAVAHLVANTAAQMGRHLDTRSIKDLLYRNLEHPRWEEVASRCLTCGNCTMVCPTCFCTTVTDVTDLSGARAERWRTWDSCFTLDFSYMHGGSVRATPQARYRQWLTHKLATWFDQFGTSGCVGCGRCITWCPVAIDITEEVRAIRASDGAGPGAAREEADGNA